MPSNSHLLLSKRSVPETHQEESAGHNEKLQGGRPVQDRGVEQPTPIR